MRRSLFVYARKKMTGESSDGIMKKSQSKSRNSIGSIAAGSFLVPNELEER